MAVDWDCEVYNAPANIPGEPDQVAALGAEYRNTADMIRQQAANIRNLVNGDGWDSISGHDFKKVAGDTADKLEQAYSRYDAAANVIGTRVEYPPAPGGNWANSLAHAQDMAKAAIRKGQDAQHASKQAQGQIDQAHQQAASNPPAAQSSGPDPAVTKLQSQKDGHDADMAQAERDLQAARDFRDAQANKAADAIVTAYNNDGLKDSTWDKIKNTVEDLAQIIGHWAGLAASILGVLALVLSWVPVLGEVLGALAAIASVVALVCDVINAADGRGSWLDVGIDVLGVLSCGAGRLLGNAAKGEKFLAMMLKSRGAGRALRIAAASDRTGVSGMKAARGLVADLPKTFGPRMLAYGKAAINPKLYIEGIQEGAKDFKFANLGKAFKPANFPTSMMSNGQAFRYIAWGTVPLAMGWANIGSVSGMSWGNDKFGPDVFGGYKKHVPFVGANGVGGGFMYNTSGG